MTLATILTAIKNKCGISGSTYDTYLTQEVNDTQFDFTRELNLPYLETKGSTDLTAYKYVYDLATNFDTMQAVVWQMDTQLIPVNFRKWRALTKSKSHGDPAYYIIHEGKLKLYPSPDTASTTTTIDGDHNASVTTITLASVTGLPDKGRCKINDEVIEWQYLDSTNLQIKNCRRGVESTTAASHSDGDDWTYRELEYSYWKTLPVLTGTDTPEVPTRYHEALILRPCASFLRDHAEELGKADRLLRQYEEVKRQAKADLGEKNAERFTTVLEDTVPRYYRDEFYPDDGSLTAA